MIVLIGASASGKTSIAKELISKYGFLKLVTTTTRPMRVGEVNGVDYHFLDVKTFKEKEKNNEFIETINYNDNYYGTDVKDVSDDKVVILDILGANKFYEKLKSKAMFFYIEASPKIIIKRMIERGDSEVDIKKRLELDKTYFDKRLMDHIDYVINTDNKSISDITKYIYQMYIERGKENGIQR